MPERNIVYDKESLSAAYKAELVTLRGILDGLNEGEKQLYGRVLRKAMTVSAMVGASVEITPTNISDDQLKTLRSRAVTTTNQAFGLLAQRQQGR